MKPLIIDEHCETLVPPLVARRRHRIAFGRYQLVQAILFYIRSSLMLRASQLRIWPDVCEPTNVPLVAI